MISQSSVFGPFSRFRVFLWTSNRVGVDPIWMVTDAEVTDEVTGGPAVIRQAWTREEAVAGLLRS